ncbi:hypothetical protein BGW38_002271 [Lunasporangiospora selenospora]|uniref:Galactosyl transferase GMA12/MNN10 family protein n=1 Tax=Lunasporangiospora selenospora TaxID=979761 RepID=A0A9P6KDJ4_9FUNG|nr:hypothetical protein BGW38_002271 [Lunasporangiospora selenospora]
MSIQAKKLYWITAAAFLLVVVLSYHKTTYSQEQDPKSPQQQQRLPQQPPPSPIVSIGNNHDKVEDKDPKDIINNDNSVEEDEEDEDENDEDDQINPGQVTPSTQLPNISRKYDTLIMIPSSWTQMRNRQWIRETIFGIKNNLEPCKKYDGRIIYKFYIHGRSTWIKSRYHSAEYMQGLVRELHGEFTEYDDYIFTNQTVTDAHTLWENALSWAVDTFIPQEDIEVNKVLIFNSTTIANLPKMEAAVKEEDAQRGFIYTWGERASFAAMMSYPVLQQILKDKALIRENNANLDLIEGVIQYYSSPAPTFTVVSEQGQLWKSDLDLVQATSLAIGQVYQQEDWMPIVQKLALQPTSACAPDLERKKNIAVLTSSYNYVNMCMTDASLPAAENKRAYAKKKGYDFVARGAEFAQEEDGLRGRQVVWGKIGAIQKTLPYYEWLFWMDMDAVIADSDVDLRAIIEEAEKQKGPEKGEISLIVARPVRDKMLNAGVMLIKNTGWSRRFLDEVQTRSDWFKRSSFEQAAIWEVMNEAKWSSQVYLFDGNDHIFNTFPKNYKVGDFVVHFAPDGCPAVPVLEALRRIKDGESLLGVGV